MSYYLPNGAKIFVASAYSASDDITALTNANPAVATATGHGLADGDIIEVNSGWSALAGRIARLDNSDTNTFELEGINTTDTTDFPAGTGTGTFREITAWTQITQVLESSTSGGEQQFTTYTPLEDPRERQIPTNKSAQSVSFQLGDDPSLAWYDVLLAADKDRVARAIRVNLANGSVLYYNALVSLNIIPTMTINEVATLQCTLSFTADPTRYAS